jgi:hypothetical protein
MLSNETCYRYTSAGVLPLITLCAREVMPRAARVAAAAALHNVSLNPANRTALYICELAVKRAAVADPGGAAHAHAVAAAATRPNTAAASAPAAARSTKKRPPSRQVTFITEQSSSQSLRLPPAVKSTTSLMSSSTHQRPRPGTSSGRPSTSSGSSGARPKPPKLDPKFELLMRNEVQRVRDLDKELHGGAVQVEFSLPISLKASGFNP